MAALPLLLLMLSIIFISALPHSTNNFSRYHLQQQEELLLKFKAAAVAKNGTSLPDWTPRQHFCNWTGIICHSNSHSVCTINLTRMSFTGTISPVLGNLSSLRFLDLSGNQLTATIPPQLGQLQNLWILWLYDNQLKGTIPPALSSCQSLYNLALSFNQLHGSIPPELSLLASLKYLHLGVNTLTEYGLGASASSKGDVYSYGILILEMVTRKRPSEEMFVGDMNLHKWVKLAFPERLADVVDSELLKDVGENMEENTCLLSFIQVGLLCSVESARERPSMRDVANALERPRTCLVGGAAVSNLTATISDLLRNTNPTEALASSSQSSTS